MAAPSGCATLIGHEGISLMWRISLMTEVEVETVLQRAREPRPDVQVRGHASSGAPYLSMAKKSSGDTEKVPGTKDPGTPYSTHRDRFGVLGIGIVAFLAQTRPDPSAAVRV